MPAPAHAPVPSEFSKVDVSSFSTKKDPAHQAEAARLEALLSPEHVVDQVPFDALAPAAPALDDDGAPILVAHAYRSVETLSAASTAGEEGAPRGRVHHADDDDVVARIDDAAVDGEHWVAHCGVRWIAGEGPATEPGYGLAGNDDVCGRCGASLTGPRLAAIAEEERVAEEARVEAERVEAERVETERVEAEREAERVEAALAIAAEEARAEEERAAEREAEAVADDLSADEAPVSTDRPDAEPLLSTDPPPAVDDPPKEG